MLAGRLALDKSVPDGLAHCLDRIVELGRTATIGRGAALPAVVRALEDPHYLVRKAAFAGLKQLFPADSVEPLSFSQALLLRNW